ncbi:MAG: hypothetical protein Q4E02_00610 [Lagierella massiliensis]|nr:hypothetical protein [Lagierella massiliensis]
MITEKNFSRYIFLLGVIILAISLVFSNFNLFGSLKPVGLSTVFICPVLGIIGIISSIRQKDYLFTFLNLLLALSFFIVMAVGYYFLGP